MRARDGLLALTLALGGCYDFGLLATAPDLARDGMADGLAAVDAAPEEPDLAALDLGRADAPSTPADLPGADAADLRALDAGLADALPADLSTRGDQGGPLPDLRRADQGRGGPADLSRAVPVDLGAVGDLHASDLSAAPDLVTVPDLELARDLRPAPDLSIARGTPPTPGGLYAAAGIVDPGAGSPVGCGDGALVAADTDGDRVVELACYAPGGGALRLFGWTMAAAPRFLGDTTLPAASTALGSADLDGDGREDSVAQRAGATDVLLGLGPSTFGVVPMATSSGAEAWDVLLADLDRDGHVDLTDTSGSDGAGGAGLRLLAGDGHGRFVGPALGDPVSALGPSLRSAAADLDGDGDLDLVLAGSSVSVRRRGATGFVADAPWALPQAARDLALGDLDGDGRPDLVVADDAAVRTYLQQAGGAFAPAAVLNPWGADPWPLALADLDGDGRLDLALGHSAAGSASTLSIWSGVGDGTFSSGPRYAMPAQGDHPVLVARDLTGDGVLDLAGRSAAEVGVLVGLGGGRYWGARRFATATAQGAGSARALTALACADLDGDGRLDALGLGASLLASFRGAADATLAAVADVSDVTLGGDVLAVGDLNGDGAPDAIALDDAARIYLGNGDGHFRAGATVSLGGGRAQDAAIGDLDGDGHADLLVAAGAAGALLLVGDWHGGLTVPTALPALPAGSSAQRLALLDLDGEGHLDVIVAGVTAGLQVLLSDGRGGYTAVSYGTGGVVPSALGTADLDGDGLADAVVGGPAPSGVGAAIAVLPAISDGRLRAPVLTSVGGAVDLLALGDLDRDGRVDVAIHDRASTQVRILRGAGAGALLAGEGYYTGGLTALRAADVDGDTRPELLGTGDGEVVVLHNLGTGTPPPTAIAARPFDLPDRILDAQHSDGKLLTADVTGDGLPDVVWAQMDRDDFSVWAGDRAALPASSGAGYGQDGARLLATADVDGDGDLDLATAVGSANAGKGADIVVNGGNGYFLRSTSLPTHDWPQAMSFGDLDADGDPDLVVASDAGTEVWWNDGHGAYARGPYLAGTVGFLGALAAGDLDGDRIPEVLLADATPGIPRVAVLHGRGDGHFDVRPDLGGSGPLVLADFDADGDLDLYVGGDAPVAYTNAGGGALGAGVRLPVSLAGAYAQAADIDRDGKLDVVVADGTHADFRWLRGLGDGSFAVVEPDHALVFEAGLGVADLNGDGWPDVVGGSAQHGLVIAWNLGRGRFLAPTRIRAGLTRPDLSVPAGIDLADLDGDGRVDVVGGGQSSSDFGLVAVRQRADGSFPVAQLSSGNDLYDAVASGDLDGDGRADVVAIDSIAGGADVYLGNGDGSLTLVGTQPVTNLPWAPRLLDLVGDAHLDLVLAEQTGKHLSVYPGRGDGSFGPVQYLPTSYQPIDLSVGDLDGDGRLDLVSPDAADAVVSVQLAQGGGAFQSKDWPSATRPLATTLGDFDRDGDLDIALTSCTQLGFEVLSNDGRGAFAETGVSHMSDCPAAIGALDYDRDGSLDLAVIVGYQHNELHLFHGRGTGTFTVGKIYFASNYIASLHVRDVDGDGLTDLSWVDQTTDVIVVHGRR